jgi:rod shape-determining protein MreD
VSEGTFRLIDQGMRRLAPLLTGLAAVLVDLLPLPDPAPQTLAPLATVCVFYFWTLYRPDLMTPLAVFAIGVMIDALGGMPIGLTSLSLLIVRSLLLTGQRFLLAQPFLVIWACFVLVVVAVGTVRWLLASLWWGRLFALEPVLLEAVLTVAIYPIVGWMLARLHQHLSVAPHAARS